MFRKRLLLGNILPLLVALILVLTLHEELVAAVWVDYGALAWVDAEAGDASYAQLFLESVSKRAKDWTANSYYRAHVYLAFAKGDLTLAMQRLQETLEGNPEDCMSRFHLGQILLRGGEPSRAVTVFREGRCNIVSYFLTRAERATEHGEEDSAAASYELALQIEPTSYPALLGLGHLMWRSGQSERALGLLSQAMAIDPDNWEPYIEIGNTYEFGFKQYDEALKWYELALERFPQETHLYRYVARIHMYQGWWDRALMELQLAPRNSYNNYLLGETYRRKGDIEQAIHYYKLVAKQEPEVLDWRMVLADMLYESKRYCEARDEYLRVENDASDAELRAAAQARLEEVEVFCDG